MVSTFAPKQQTSLPEPSSEALIISQELSRLIKKQCIDSGGWLGFDEFMNSALYTPQLGYYSGQSLKFGADGDFTTAPEISPMFAQTLAGCFSAWMMESAPYILEFGAGSGQFALDTLLALAAQKQLPKRYFIVELSENLRIRQQEKLKTRAPALFDMVTWLDRLPENFSGVIFANEVLDALPQKLFVKHNQDILERGVSVNAQHEFAWQDKVAQTSLIKAVIDIETELNQPLADGFVSEFSPYQHAWLNSLVNMLEKGVICLVDYGFDIHEFYHPQRHMGTLMCHYRHFAHDNPFFYPGLQDITAHVNFSWVAKSLTQAGLDLLGYSPQGNFLLNAGMLNQLANINQTTTMDYFKASQQAQQLVSEAEMGSLFKVIGFSKNIDPNRVEGAFASCDRSYLL